jgi:hypothetical protein
MDQEEAGKKLNMHKLFYLVIRVVIYLRWMKKRSRMNIKETRRIKRLIN